MNPRLAVWIVNGLLAGLAAASLFPLLWMLSVSLMPAGEASAVPPPSTAYNACSRVDTSPARSSATIAPTVGRIAVETASHDEST